jgi:spore coat polysaccharide biosynthesis protein SpsF
MMDICGRSMLSHHLRRLKACQAAGDVVLATTSNSADDVIVREAEREGVRWFRGSEEDVLSRYVGAAREAQADVIVRVTSDCPLIDPDQTDRVIADLVEHYRECDYAANILERSFPRGLDTEAFMIDTLERLHRLGTTRSHREHPTSLLVYERRDLFLVRSIVDCEDNSDLRWTVDEPADLEMIRCLYQELEMSDRILPYDVTLALARRHPSLTALNTNVVQKSC